MSIIGVRHCLRVRKLHIPNTMSPISYYTIATGEVKIGARKSSKKTFYSNRIVNSQKFSKLKG